MALFDFLKPGFFRPDPLRENAHALYAATGDHARLPCFFQELGVADTFDGRFDVLALHIHLLIRRAGRDEQPGPRFAQFLFEVMIKDLDQGLRLSGIGDIGIGHRVKKMTGAYYGRATAYDAALDSGTPGELEQAIRRNVYRESPPDAVVSEQLAAYVSDCANRLDQAPLSRLTDGTFRFPTPHLPAPRPRQAGTGPELE